MKKKKNQNSKHKILFVTIFHCFFTQLFAVIDQINEEFMNMRDFTVFKNILKILSTSNF